MSDHVTDWTADELASEFAQLDSALWWRLGYAFLPNLLKCDHQRERRTFLDLGCGTGAIANWIATETGASVIGVDQSPAMIRAARLSAAPRTRYLVRAGDRTKLPRGSVDAAWAAFVMVCLPHLAAVRRLIAELARVVRPGGQVVILDSHPATTGVDFGDVIQGEPGANYTAGDPLPVRMRRLDGGWESITDTYWSRETYDNVLTEAGFEYIEYHAPLLGDPSGRPGVDRVASDQRSRWREAEERPPFLLVSARRRSSPAG